MADLPQFIIEAADNKVRSYDGLWFLRDLDKISKEQYQIEYSLVILHALWTWMKANQESVEEDILQLLDKTGSALSNKGGLLREEYYLEVFRLTEMNDSYCVVDQSNACFPLILYGDEARSDPFHKGRATAFRNRLINIKAKLSKLCPQLRDAGLWNKKYQDKLLRIIFESK